MAGSLISRTWDNDYAMLLFVHLLLSLIGVGYMASQGIQTGYIYVTMFLIGVGLLYLASLIFKDSMKRITQYVKIPFVTSSYVAGIAYLIGRAAPIALYGLNRALNTKFEVYKLSLSVWGQGIISGQTFAAAQIETSPAWQFFNFELTAGTIETFFYNFSLMIAGVILGMWIVGRFTDKVDLKRSMFLRGLVIVIALVFSALIFAGSHTLNNTYVGWMYVFAGVFMAVSTASMYFALVPLMFWLGYHMSNNLVAYAAEFGWAAVAKGYYSWYGVISVSLILFTVVFVLRRASQGKENAYVAWRNRFKSV